MENRKRGRLIVLESLGDNYGKTTIVKHLMEKLNNTKTLSFPNNETYLGHAIRQHMSDKKIV